MKKLLPLLFILFIAGCKKEEFCPNLTKEFSIQSATNGATYQMKVALPFNYDPSQKYSTIYVLDGENDFDFVAKNCKIYSSDFSKQDVLVVSIGYGNDRATDYTPTDANEGDGGAENFALFIKNELIPKMEVDFGADTARQKRTILGHSFGGLFAAYAFTNHNEVFGNYIMLSPSIWYDNEVLLKLEQENREKNKNNFQNVFMGLGELENSGRMLAPYMAFYDRLKNNYSDMHIVSHLQPHVDHNGSKNPNIKEALRLFFQNK